MAKRRVMLTNTATAAITQIGENIRTARLRRNLTIETIANRSDLSEGTVRRLEQGDPGVSLGALASVLVSLNLESMLEEVARPANDLVGTNLDALRQRRRASNNSDHDLDTDF